MITNRLMLLYHSHFLTSTNTFFPKLLSSPNFFSLLRTTTSVTSSHTHSSSSSYGPSLQKGIIPYPTLKSLQNPFSNTAHNHPQQTQIPENDEESPFDEEQFTRVFAIAAIRVPSERCFEIEGRIRGHLLNWPRVSNIARVPGDEVDSEIQELLRAKKELGDEVEKEVSRRVYGKAEGDGEELSGVLYRDKLAKEFNSRGFVNFRNLAKISRPSKGKKRRKEGGGNDKSCGDVGEKAREKRKSVVVEVVEESEDDGDDLSGLLGDEFKGRKWRGSTRLLLLDETFAGRTFDELPEAVKAVLNEGSSEAVNSSYELVRCNMTLLYDYWSNDEILESLLPKDMVVPSAFESVGHIAHLNLKDEHLPYKKVIAKVLLDKNKPKIRTVVNKIEAISNDYRTMELEVLAGNHSLVTTVIESGMRFQVDLAKVYWNSRLSTERQRLISCFASDDVLSVSWSSWIVFLARCQTLKIMKSYTEKAPTIFLLPSCPISYEELPVSDCYAAEGKYRSRLTLIDNKGNEKLPLVGDVFSGVGPIAISAAKKVRRVYANDLNPYAVDYLERNTVLNKLERKIEVYNMDGRRFIEAIFSSEKTPSVTQVVMNLPNNAVEFLDAFRGIFRNQARDRKLTLPMIHIYGFSKAEDPEFDFHERIRVALEEAAFPVEMRRVRAVAPGKWMLCASFALPETVAFSKDYVDCR